MTGIFAKNLRGK